MAGSEPWMTLGRGYDASLAIVSNEARERYLAFQHDALAGFLVLDMKGAFVGYIQIVCVAPPFRNRGIGTRLIQFAEERIFRDAPNAFLCVSSFNPDARRLYERLGYRVVGELSDYLLRGHSEFLLRKTLGPIEGYSPRKPPGDNS
jgi:ribosomal-protein-alanine N-acetyltransferase